MTTRVVNFWSEQYDVYSRRTEDSRNGYLVKPGPCYGDTIAEYLSLIHICYGNPVAAIVRDKVAEKLPDVLDDYFDRDSVFTVEPF